MVFLCSRELVQFLPVTLSTDNAPKMSNSLNVLTSSCCFLLLWRLKGQSFATAALDWNGREDRSSAIVVVVVVVVVVLKVVVVVLKVVVVVIVLKVVVVVVVLKAVVRVVVVAVKTEDT